MYKKIVVGYDGSDPARDAVEQAVDLATATGSSVHLVTAVGKNDKVVRMGESSDTQFLSESEIARRNLKDLATNYRHLDISFEAVPGSPAKVLVGEAKSVDADLILVGNRHVQGIGRVLGSVAEDVAHNAPCAVLIAKTT